jgi:hypothetical protein
MKNKETGLLDEHLQSLAGITEAHTDDFFYTRLKARMEAAGETNISGKGLVIKPVWAIATLLFLLALNGFMLMQQSKLKTNGSGTASTIEQFAKSYDQTISAY